MSTQPNLTLNEVGMNMKTCWHFWQGVGGKGNADIAYKEGVGGHWNSDIRWQGGGGGVKKGQN